MHEQINLYVLQMKPLKQDKEGKSAFKVSHQFLFFVCLLLFFLFVCLMKVWWRSGTNEILLQPQLCDFLSDPISFSFTYPLSIPGSRRVLFQPFKVSFPAVHGLCVFDFYDHMSTQKKVWGTLPHLSVKLDPAKVLAEFVLCYCERSLLSGVEL